MNRRSVRREGATEAIVAEGILMFDQVLKKQVGRDARILLHPAEVDRCLRNGWIRLPDDQTEPGAEPESKPARRSRKNVV